MKQVSSEFAPRRAEGRVCGLAYDTELAGPAGVSVHIWVTPELAAQREALTERLAAAERAMRNARDAVRFQYSVGRPTSFWAHSDVWPNQHSGAENPYQDDQ